MLDAARGRVVEVVDIEDMHDGRERQMALVVPSEGPQRVEALVAALEAAP
jgi:hypothetical protein